MGRNHLLGVPRFRQKHNTSPRLLHAQDTTLEEVLLRGGEVKKCWVYCHTKCVDDLFCKDMEFEAKFKQLYVWFLYEILVDLFFVEHTTHILMLLQYCS